MEQKLAYRPGEIPKYFPIGRTKVYSHISSGALPAYKNGGSTIIFHEDIVSLLRNLPRARSATSQSKGAARAG